MKLSLRTALSATAALLLAAALFVPAATGQEAAAQPAGDTAPDLATLIAKNLDAKGGEAALRAVKSVRINGTMSMGGGQMTAPFVWEWKAPNKLRMEFTLQGMTGVQAFDGDSGWMIMPFAGKTDPEKMPEELASELKDQADFYGPFVDTEEKGYTLELVGEEEVEGTPAYKVKVTNDRGDVTWVYLDQDYGLEIESVSKRKIQGQEIEATTSIGDYKPVGDLVVAHSFDVTAKGAPTGGQTLTFDSVELNPDLPDARFEMPAAAAAPASEGNDGGGGR